MGAVGQLGKMAQDLNEALKAQFAKNASLAASKTMKISGNLSISPMIDEPAVYQLSVNPSQGAQPVGTVVASASGSAAPAVTTAAAS